MTALGGLLGGAAPGDPAAPPDTEHALAARVLEALLREGYGGLADHVVAAPDGPALRLPGARGRTVPLVPDGFLADLRVRDDACLGGPLTLDAVIGVLSAVADSRDTLGVAAFDTECREALDAVRLLERHRSRVDAELLRDPPGGWRGLRGNLRYDTLAARRAHPVHPASHGRHGLTDDESLRYAPEFFPRFRLAWAAVPRTALHRAGRPLPACWPTVEDVGLPWELAATHELVPVHPLTARRVLGASLAAIPGAMAAPEPYLDVAPTLSTRTVAVADEPGTHLKLPLPISSLGLRNLRLIPPSALADGALVAHTLSAVTARDEALDTSRDTSLGALLLADDTSYAHAGDPFLGYLVRRYPAGLDSADVVPLAALLADIPAPRPVVGAGGRTAPCPPASQSASLPARGTRLVAEELADRWFGGDLRALVDAYLRVLFETHVRLLVRYGIALEAHQQNTALVLDSAGPRLLVKDFDGALVHHARLAAALGADAPGRDAFADDRLLTDSDDALADVFITIVVHLCAGALAFGLAGRAGSREDILASVRRHLGGALDGYGDAPAAALLRRRVLEAERLPGKSMVTAGTLVEKARTGARDINKFYGCAGPNYLAVPTL